MNTVKAEQQPAVPDLAEFLAAVALFSGLDLTERTLLATEFVPIRLKQGECLIEQGALGEALYVLHRGKLRITKKDMHDEEMTLAVLGPGVCVGEIALLTGERRNASVYAEEACEVYSLTKQSFEALRQQSPHTIAHFSKAIVAPLQRGELQNILYVSDLFGDMSKDALKALEEALELMLCASGERLIRQGEESDSAYIIISGRLRVLLEQANGSEHPLFELGRGRIVGEIAMITGGKRTATVRAIRDTLLAKLSKVAFEQLLHAYPLDMMKHFAGSIVNRLLQQTLSKPKSQYSVVNMAIIPTGQDVPLTRFTERLANILSNAGPTLHLNAQLLENHLSPRGIAQTAVDDPNSSNIARWLNHQESQYRYVLYEADTTASEWTKRALRQADRILLVGDAAAAEQPGEIETELLNAPTYHHLPKSLILLHPGSPEGYHETRRWLAPRQVQNHYHVQLNNDDDIARIGRLVTGRGIGLVVSGGGARGFAHIGGIRALKEAGIPIDKVGGTSMGSIVAAMLALCWDYDTMLKQMLSFNYKMDYTFPAVSFASGSRFTKGLMERFKDVQIEDLRLSFFCVTTDLCTASQKTHTSGPLWRYVRASASIPGLYPPMIVGESFLIDGGVVNNMPVDLMQKCDDIGQTIAFDVGGSSDLETDFTIDGSLSGWKIFRYLDRST